MTELERVHEFYLQLGGLLDADLGRLADFCETTEELHLVVTMQLLRKLAWLKP